MLVKIFMKVLKNLFGNYEKINASEIALKKDNNKAATLDNYVKKNIITSGLSTNKESTSSKTEKIMLDKVLSQVGNKLTLENGCIKIGAGVSKVLVSANLLEQATTAGLYGANIHVNQTDLAHAVNISFDYINDVNQMHKVTLSQVLVDVKENDLIILSRYSQNTAKVTLVAYDARAVNLTVEVVE